MLPFGMLQWSPETTRGKHNRTTAPGGYEYNHTRARGFALTHLSGTGCAGASGDIPFMPITTAVTSSPSADATDSVYASDFSHADETAQAGYYKVKLANGSSVALTAAMRSGMADIDFPAGKPANLLIRTSDSEVGCSAAQRAASIRPARTVTGSVTSGNFCGYLAEADKKSYYTLYFVAEFDQPFTRRRHLGRRRPCTRARQPPAAAPATARRASSPTARAPARGSTFGDKGAKVGVRVGISYVSLANARANLQAEIPDGTTLRQRARGGARRPGTRTSGRIAIDGGTPDQRTTFYTALYHVMMHPNVYSDVNGQYRGFDQKTHTRRRHAASCSTPTSPAGTSTARTCSWSPGSIPSAAATSRSRCTTRPSRTTASGIAGRTTPAAPT